MLKIGISRNPVAELLRQIFEQKVRQLFGAGHLTNGFPVQEHPRINMQGGSITEFRMQAIGKILDNVIDWRVARLEQSNELFSHLLVVVPSCRDDSQPSCL